MTGLTLPLLLWTAVIAAVVIVDLSAYLVAAARAQQLADGAALAAALAALGPDVRGPRAAAEELARTGGGSLIACDCDRDGHAEVIVGVAVPGLVVPRMGAGQVQATASATLMEARGG